MIKMFIGLVEMARQVKWDGQQVVTQNLWTNAKKTLVNSYIFLVVHRTAFIFNSVLTSFWKAIKNKEKA